MHEMLQARIIYHNSNPFTSPVLLIKKKGLTGCFNLNYRQLNKITIKYKYLIPIIDELLDELHDSTIFTKLDLQAGSHQIPMADPDIYKTTFSTRHGHF